MLDKKTTTVLKSLGKLSQENAYKVVTVEEVLNTLPTKIYDVDSVKQTVDYLCKQEYIVIKFEEDFTFCYSLLPKARIYLETENEKGKTKKKRFPYWWFVLTGIISGITAFLANIMFYYFVM